MYEHKEETLKNWSYFSGWGFKHLNRILKREGHPLSSMAIIGIGSGVEGILAGKISQPYLEELVITDIDDGVASGAFRNIKAVISPNIYVQPLKGSFCQPISETICLPTSKNIYGLKVDLVYGNIPNLPALSDMDLSKGAEKGTFVPPQLYDCYNPPSKFKAWGLAAQYAFLQSAKSVLRPGGSIVTALGGRMPIKIVEELFEVCELEFEDVIVGFKEQTEAKIDFEGYHRLEKENGVSFEFYLYQEVIDFLRDKGISNPSDGISGRILKSMLRPYMVSAGAALKLYERNIPVGHTVHLFRGVQ